MAALPDGSVPVVATDLRSAVVRVLNAAEDVREHGDTEPDLAGHDLSHLVGVLRALELAARS